MADGEAPRATTTGAIRELTERISQLERGQERILTRLDGMCAQMTTTCETVGEQNKALADHERRILLREVAYRERIEPAMEKLDAVLLRLEGLSVQVQRGALYGSVGGGGIVAGIGLAVGIIGKMAGWW